MQEYFSNFRRYLGNGQRLSIFGKEKDGKLEVFILKANAKDQFSKSIAKVVYDAYTLGCMQEDGTVVIGYSNSTAINHDMKFVIYHPSIISLSITEGNTANFEFVQFCKQFYEKVQMVDMQVRDYLVKGTDIIKLK